MLLPTGEEEIEDACRRINIDVNDMIQDADAGPMKVYSAVRQSASSAAAEGFSTPLRRLGARAADLVESALWPPTSPRRRSPLTAYVVYVVDPGFTKQKVYNPSN